MDDGKRYKIPSKRKLILLSSLAITVLLALPRLGVWRQLDQSLPHIQFRPAGFLLRTLSVFLTAVIFYVINLETRKWVWGPVVVNFNKFYQRIIVNTILFLVVNFLLIRLHLLLLTPQSTVRVYRFLFNVNMLAEVILVILTAQIYHLVFSNYQIRMSNESLLKTNAETRYEVLKHQVNPHFLFNSLNTINALILHDKQQAIHFVNNMSDVFRYVLESSNTDRITLKEEIRLIEAYADMLKGRYGDRLHMQIEVPSIWFQYTLPPMALQILVENAVKHNILTRNKPLTVRIFINDENDLIVCNNLQQRKLTEPSTGLGLHNLNLRSKYLSNREIVVQRTDIIFSVTIPLIQ